MPVTKTKKVLILGAGGQGRIIANILTLRSGYDVSGFLDRNLSLPGVLGSMECYSDYLSTHYFFIAIGDNDIRARLFKDMKKAGARFVNAVHPTALIENTVVIGENIFIGAHAYLNVGATLGDTVYINNHCIIEHDVEVGSHSNITTGVVTGGEVRFGEYSFVGLGAVINDHLTIGDRVTIGSGSVVIDHIPANSVAVGVPAKVIKMKEAPKKK